MKIDHATTFLDATARNSGLTFTPEALSTAAAELAASVERDPAGAFSYTPEGYSTAFRIESGASVEIPAAEHVATLIRRHAQAAAPKVQAPGTPDTSLAAPSSAPGWTRYGRGPVTEFAKAFAAAEDAKLQKEIATWPNPWAKGRENRTRQNVISNRNPALAAKFRAQAGA